MTKARQKFSIPEGTWFAVPLRTGGYVVGLLARATGSGPAFGYFFGPRIATVPDIRSTENLSHKDAVFVAIFGDLGLIKNEWPIIGTHKEWKREDWPVVPFARIDEEGKKGWKVTYSDELRENSNECCDIFVAKLLPRDGLWGYGAVEKQMTSLLESQ
jgi:hypothetical protein